jgi:hypothetical protein
MIVDDDSTPGFEPKRLLETQAFVGLQQTEFLTMYKPNFCSECGERIARARFHLWTNRRFCSDCSPRLRKSQIVSSLITAAVLVGAGFGAGRAGRPPSPPLILEQRQLPALAAPAENDGASREHAHSQTGGAPSAGQVELSYGPDGSATERPTDPNETVSICGARTKKGTPCSRRVRGTGRCWQHKGMPAMVPVEKLVITGN